MFTPHPHSTRQTLFALKHTIRRTPQPARCHVVIVEHWSLAGECAASLHPRLKSGLGWSLSEKLYYPLACSISFAGRWAARRAVVEQTRHATEHAKGAPLLIIRQHTLRTRGTPPLILEEKQFRAHPFGRVASAK